ncbi:MAG: hypothetical protein ACRCW6_03110 [Mycoplasmoidaceae bacterium]
MKEFLVKKQAKKLYKKPLSFLTLFAVAIMPLIGNFYNSNINKIITNPQLKNPDPPIDNYQKHINIPFSLPKNLYDFSNEGNDRYILKNVQFQVPTFFSKTTNKLDYIERDWNIKMTEDQWKNNLGMHKDWISIINGDDRDKYLDTSQFNFSNTFTNWEQNKEEYYKNYISTGDTYDRMNYDIARFDNDWKNPPTLYDKNGVGYNALYDGWPQHDWIDKNLAEPQLKNLIPPFSPLDFYGKNYDDSFFGDAYMGDLSRVFTFNPQTNRFYIDQEAVKWLEFNSYSHYYTDWLRKNNPYNMNQNELNCMDMLVDDVGNNSKEYQLYKHFLNQVGLNFNNYLEKVKLSYWKSNNFNGFQTFNQYLYDNSFFGWDFDNRTLKYGQSFEILKYGLDPNIGDYDWAEVNQVIDRVLDRNIKMEIMSTNIDDDGNKTRIESTYNIKDLIGSDIYFKDVIEKHNHITLDEVYGSNKNPNLSDVNILDNNIGTEFINSTNITPSTPITPWTPTNPSTPIVVHKNNSFIIWILLSTLVIASIILFIVIAIKNRKKIKI